MKFIKNKNIQIIHEGMTIQKLRDFEKVVVVFMFLALATEILALAWNLFSFCACCCKKVGQMINHFLFRTNLHSIYFYSVF